MTDDTEKKRLVVGISGASGSVLAIELLKCIKELDQWESHVVVSRGAVLTLAHEAGKTPSFIAEYADQMYGIDELGANIASGTFRTEGMVIVPCSMKTVAGVVTGFSDNLLLRAADVVLKERRKLVAVARETPLSTIHLRNMLRLAEAGGVVMPPVISYYTHPDSLEAVTRQIVGKILNEFGVEVSGFKRWGNQCTTADTPAA